MKKIISIVVAILSLSSCATIFGGGKYNAHIQVVNDSDADIIYQGQVIGRGNAFLKVKRKDADKFQFSVKKEGKEEQKYNYHSRTFRGWSLVGSILGWTGYLPWGVIVDGINGAWWKPDVSEAGVVKQDYKNYKYLVNYNLSKQKSNLNRGFDVIYLKNGSVIRGTIVEQIPNETIKIKTKDESIFVYKIVDIEKITKE